MHVIFNMSADDWIDFDINASWAIARIDSIQTFDVTKDRTATLSTNLERIDVASIQAQPVLTLIPF